MTHLINYYSLQDYLHFTLSFNYEELINDEQYISSDPTFSLDITNNINNTYAYSVGHGTRGTAMLLIVVFYTLSAPTLKLP